MEQGNRKSWVNQVAIGMAPLFGSLDVPLPSRVRRDQLHQLRCKGQGNRRMLGQPVQR